MNLLAWVTVMQSAITGGFALVGATAIGLRRRHNTSPSTTPAVVLLRPCEHVDSTLAARFRRDAFAYSHSLFSVVCAGQPGGERSDLRVHDTSVNSPPADTNRKMRHLAAGFRWAESEGKLADDPVIVQADADVELLPGDVDALVAALEQGAPNGAAFAAPLPTGGGTISEHLARAVVSFSPQAFTNLHALARMTGGPPALAGKLVAIRTSTLRAIGGYERFGDFIGDDIAMVDALHEARRPIALAARPAHAIDTARTLRKLEAQLSRWLTVASSHRRGLLAVYPLLVAPLPMTLVLATLTAISGLPQLAMATLAFAFFGRFALATALYASLRSSSTPYLSWRDALPIPLSLVAGDALLLFAALRATGRHDLRWAGHSYTIGNGGRIVRAEAIESP